jgi:hypothetical protein
MRGDPFAPSGQREFKISLLDLQQHLLVFGGTGSGKTSGVLRPLVSQIASWDGVGLVVLDGKGSLPVELAKLPGMQLVQPGKVTLCLVAGPVVFSAKVGSGFA